MRIAPKSLAFTILLGFLAALPVLSIDISAPTLVLLPEALDTSTVVAGLTLSLFMVGFAIGQCAGGWSSDRSGRRPVLLVSLTCYVIAGIACAASPTGAALISSRFVQGLGAGACSVLAFAIVQDLFEGDMARAKRSFVSVVFGVVPLLAPALGAWLSEWLDWRAVHWTMALAGSALLVVIVWFFQESRPKPTGATVGVMPTKLARLHDDHRFVAFAAINALSYGCIFAYIAGSPILMIDHMGLTASTFAALFACTAAALTMGALISGRLSRRGVRADVLIRASLAVAAAATCTLVVLSVTPIDADVSVSSWLVLLVLVITFFCRGVTAPNLQHIAVERWRDQAGTASAAVGVSQLLVGASTSAVVAVLLPRFGQLAVTVPMALCAAAALVLWWKVGADTVPDDRLARPICD